MRPAPILALEGVTLREDERAEVRARVEAVRRIVAREALVLAVALEQMLVPAIEGERLAVRGVELLPGFEQGGIGEMPDHHGARSGLAKCDG